MRRSTDFGVRDALVCASLILISMIPVPAMAKTKPLFRDFMGLCGHTVLFKPELYRQTCRLVRDYHGFNWDVGEDTDFELQFPFARNRVNWETLYSSWRDHGFSIDVSIMFSGTPPDQWRDLPKDAYRYGFAFARFFGPTNGKALVECVEIGNEPGHYDDRQYRTLFENMARGIRDGDPALRIATCAVTTGDSGKYAKSISCLSGLENLYDVINIHVYAHVENWPTWRRSYPEDPDIDYLTTVQEMIDWRNQNAPDKQVWITEFGWDASTKPAPKTGTFKDWIGSTETEQARYLVRSFFEFSRMDVDRAYIFFFNDDDEPRVHGSSGLTRNFQPKPAFFAVAHLYETLGDYRFNRVITRETGELHVYEYVRGDNPNDRIWAVWSPTGTDRIVRKRIEIAADEIGKVERMPLSEGDGEAVDWTSIDPDSIEIDVGESPIYIHLMKTDSQ